MFKDGDIVRYIGWYHGIDLYPGTVGKIYMIFPDKDYCNVEFGKLGTISVYLKDLALAPDSEVN